MTEADHRPLEGVETERQVAVLHAAWRAFDEAIMGAEGHELRRGPRGGGRDIPRLLEHCLQADQVHLSKLGAGKPRVGSDDRQEIETAMCERALQTLIERTSGLPVSEPNRAKELWPPRWFMRYASWHALVHAWDIEDRRLD